MKSVDRNSDNLIRRHMRVRDGKELLSIIDPIKDKVLETRLSVQNEFFGKPELDNIGLEVAEDKLATALLGGASVLIVCRANPDHVLAVSTLIRGLNLIIKGLQTTRDVVQTSRGALGDDVRRFNLNYFCCRSIAENPKVDLGLDRELESHPDLIILLDPVCGLIPRIKRNQVSADIVTLVTHRADMPNDVVRVGPLQDMAVASATKEYTVTAVAYELVLRCRNRLIELLSKHARTQALTAQLKTAGLEVNETFVALSYLCDDMPMAPHVRAIVSSGVDRISRGWALQPRTAHSRGILCYGLRHLLVESEAIYPFTTQQLQMRLIPLFSSVCYSESPETLVNCLLADKTKVAQEMAEKASFLKAKTYFPSLTHLASLIGATPKISGLSVQDAELLTEYEEREFDNDARLFPIYAERCYAETGKTQLVRSQIDNGLVRCFLRSDYINVNDVLRDIGYKMGERSSLGFWADAFSGDFLLEANEFSEFKKELDCYLKNCTPDVAFLGAAIIDGPLAPNQRVTALAQWLEKQAWGRLFPEPIFEQEFVVLSSSVLMDTHQRFLVDDHRGVIKGGGEAFEMLWRNCVPSHLGRLSAGQVVSVKYRLRTTRDGSFSEVYGDVLELEILKSGELN
ncbi:single-stranded-DNA-specific exonuclease RecJ family protein [Marinobacter shengliensis]|uniref:single-stranded-DNA-specific exonuclease RecJ-like protein n=1 Tax=Marinobacter shengliensis TaxID=1389223 RepID=UPI001109100E|nr:single-stranded-DNA-specific exonuclease RecJ-like protein [Marinobacter shengliensis]